MPALAQASKKRRSIARIVALGFLYTLWATFVFVTPILGAWLSSALAAYAGGNVRLAAASGLLLFPVIPLAWEGFSEWRRRKKNVRLPRILTLGDRLLLRTLLVNCLFIGVVLGSRPEAACRALAARGDWMLDGVQGADRARSVILYAADRIGFLHRLVRDNPYDERDSTAGKLGLKPPPLPRDDKLVGDASGDAQKPPNPDLETKGDYAPIDATRPWPSTTAPHPAALNPPPVALESVETLGAYFRSAEPANLQRLKAVHDWVALHIAYDAQALKTKEFPPQTAAAVFLSRRGVCAGYARLMVAIGASSGLDIRYVVGDAKGAGGEVDGAGHAWNIATVDGKSYVLDATWDAGSVSDDFVFTRGYRSEYLMTPPEIFVRDHLPKEAADQLLAMPIDRGEFMRMPQLRPAFFASGLTLKKPTRSQVTVHNSLDIHIAVERGPHFMMASVEPQGGGARKDCSVRQQDGIDIQCTFDAPGTYRVLMFRNTQRYGTYAFVGELGVVSRNEI